MRTVIVEDERPILELMKLVIGRNRHLEIVGQYTDSREAMEGIPGLLPDVVFVDVEMPFMDGIELSRKIKNFNEDIQIVFVTVYEKYALDAFKVDAVNYILKPITEEDLNATVDRLLKNRHAAVKSSEDDKKNKMFILGSFRVYGSSGREITRWSTSKVQELFAYFVHKKGKCTSKWELCDILWPKFHSKKAEHNLYSTIYRLKTVLNKAEIENTVYCENGKYGMDFESFYCDSWEFESFIENNSSVDDRNIGDWEKNTALYKGVLFGNDDYLWDMELNEKLVRYYSLSTKNIARYYMKMKIYSKSEEYLKKAIAANSFDEEAHDLMMQIYFYMGNKTALVRHYKKLSDLFQKELHIKPKESTLKLYKSLLIKL
ncbi:response regulator [Clostridium sp. WLY-B-L2]|uniref:Stage 0 sporulation protein A homolog n=1 Tax=Clostridium aromativorans TaxID=2836848 RepID=A0ABS8N3F8_9CLOT|nr:MULTISPECIES: response regulator [Clostridium]KAA8679399.1 response regulator [Clostridium sp. HV4-5-A1G]MCC9294337.1 response regulator [Clostridium aromativorans]